MCGGAKPPTPVAPPAPIPQRSSNIDGTRERQANAARQSTGGYEATMLTGKGSADANTGATASPTLGK